LTSSSGALWVAVDLGDQRRRFFGPIGYVLRDILALASPVPCRADVFLRRVTDDAAVKHYETSRTTHGEQGWFED
jgi:hypothetical protein